MKKSVINFLTLVVILCVTSACNEEEFYEKDYIETFQDQEDVPGDGVTLTDQTVRMVQLVQTELMVQMELMGQTELMERTELTDERN